MNMSYNDKVDFVNAASRQLEAKLALENTKLRELLKKDAHQQSTQSHFDEGNRRGSSHFFESNSSTDSRPAPYSYSGKPVDYFRGPTTVSVPPANGSIGGTVTTWEWGTVRD